MLRCREISKLVSESMERDLPFRVRIELWMHLAMCRMCSGFARQIRLVRRAVREDPERLAAAKDDPEARLRIRHASKSKLSCTVRSLEMRVPRSPGSDLHGGVK